VLFCKNDLVTPWCGYLTALYHRQNFSWGQPRKGAKARAQGDSCPATLPLAPPMLDSLCIFFVFQISICYSFCCRKINKI